MKYQSWISILSQAIDNAVYEGNQRSNLCWVLSDDIAKDIMQEISFVLQQLTVTYTEACENSLMGLPAYEAKLPGTLFLCSRIQDLSTSRLLTCTTPSESK